MEQRYVFRPLPPAAVTPRREGRSVVLTGFMGTGKTAAGQELADILGAEFLDTDRLIEAREGLTVSEIFAQRGEAVFRQREREVCAEVVGRRGLVIATGGGALLDKDTFAALAGRAHLVLLEASVEAIADRVGEGMSRPLLQGNEVERRKRIEEILAERQTIYRRIPNRIDTSNLTPRETALQIASDLEIPSTVLALEHSRIEIGRGLILRLGARLQSLGLGRRVFVLIAEGVRPLFEDQIAASLHQHAIGYDLIGVQDGDVEKTLAQVGRMVTSLAERGATRDTTVVAVGGGVTGDLAGFAAGIYMRGIPLVQVPTTLLAQVDASIGGKVGANLPQGKNLVGSFHPPALVLSDACALQSLPPREIANGMAEVVKTALIGSPELFDLLSAEWEPNSRFWERCVNECAAIKGAVVDRDLRESGERQILNLGHTVGHALEAAAGYEGLSHGEGVSVGLLVAMRLSARRGLLAEDWIDRTRRILLRCGLPVTPPRYDRDRLLTCLHRDKKKRGGRLRFVLPVCPGEMVVIDDVADEDVLTALTEESP